MSSTITLTFVNIPSIGDNININIESDGVPLTPFYEVFRTLRGANYQTKIGVDIDIQAQYFVQAWNLDWKNFGGTNNLISLYTSNTVIINLLDPSWQFVVPTGSAIASGDVTYVINNETPESPKEITFVDYTPYVSSPCGSVYANYNVTGGNGSYNVWVNNIQQIFSQASPLAVLVPRGFNATIFIQDSSNVSIGTVYKTAPKKVFPFDFSFNLLNLSSGVTVEVSVNGSIFNEPYEYSLTNDGLDWQVSNIFSGLAPGTYTVYVKDVFGCVTASNTIILDGTTEIVETIATISEINALRFALLEQGAKKNHKNTLACQELKQIKFPFYHRYTPKHIIPTQFKTNAYYINIFTLDINGNTNTQVVTKMTNNIGLEAKSTSTYFSLGSGRSAIYFGVVDILNVLTEAVEDTVDFGFTLPEWADSVGKVVNIEGIGDVEVSSIGYSETYDSFILEFDISYTGVPVEKILYSQYNLQPYEVYETSIIMSSEPENFNLVMELGINANNIDYTYVSEPIKKIVDNDRYFDIEYWDDENKGDMIYQTGIKHKLMLEGMQNYVGFQEIEGYDGDTEHYVTKNTVFDAIKFWFFRLSSEMAHKLRLVFGHKYLKINGLYYKISEVPEIKDSPTSNFKTFSVILKRSGEQFLTDAQEYITLDETNDSIAAAIEASKGKAMILWTKTNG